MHLILIIQYKLYLNRTQLPSVKGKFALDSYVRCCCNNVNYHFKSSQLKKALIRLALPLDSHSLRGTSTDLCVFIQQRVYMCVCLCVCIQFLTLWLSVVEPFNLCLRAPFFFFFCKNLNVFLYVFFSVCTWISAQHDEQDMPVQPQSPQVRMQTVCYDFRLGYAHFVFITDDLCHSRI